MAKSEPFIDDDEAKQMTGTTFIVIGCMALAAATSSLLYWAYNRHVSLFHGIMWTIVFMYSTINLAFIAVSKNRLKPLMFKFFIALHSTIAIISLLLFTVYFITASKGMSSRSISQYDYNREAM